MTTTPHVIRMSFGSTPKNVRKVEGFLMKLRRTVYLDDIQFHKLMVSLTEAVNNAIVHGNKCDAARRVTVVAEVLPGWLLCMVDDQGGGFKPEKVENPLAKRNLLKESGRGIFLMRTLMDKVEFEHKEKGTQVRLWLDLGKNINEVP